MLCLSWLQWALVAVGSSLALLACVTGMCLLLSRWYWHTGSLREHYPPRRRTSVPLRPPDAS